VVLTTIKGTSGTNNETVTQMITRLSSIILAIALVSTANAGLRLAGAPIALPAGTTGVQTLTLQYTNDTGVSQTLFGFELLDYTLSTTHYVGSDLNANPTLINNIVDVSSTSWTEFGGGAAPLGSIGWASPFGLTIAAGGATTIGTFDVNIPADFLGEFVLASADPSGVTVTSATGQEPGVQLDPVDDLVTVGTGTAVPEPSSFLFLGLVGTGMIGFRRMRRQQQQQQQQQEELVEVE